MPLYEYRCEGCDSKLERLSGFTDAPPPCPLCPGQMKKQISQCSFQLKGRGWYKDAYSGKSNKVGHKTYTGRIDIPVNREQP